MTMRFADDRAGTPIRGARPRGRLRSALVALALLAAPLVAQAEQDLAIELVALSSPDEAEQAAASAREKLGPATPVRVETVDGRFLVLVGNFATTAEAWEALRQVREGGYEAARIIFVAPLANAPVSAELPEVRTDSERPPATVEAAPVEAPSVAEEATAAPPPATAPRPGAKQIHAVRAADAPRVDGALDDGAWSAATFVSDFEQKGAYRGYPPRLRTEVAFLYDDHALYVGARMHVRKGTNVRAPTTPRDQISDADRLIVSLDTYRNRQSAYNFGVTAGGTRIDFYQPRDEFEVRDFTFDPIWNARVKVNHADWTAEMRIPFSSLRFLPRDPQVWGLNLQRVSPKENLYSFWVVVPGTASGWPSRFGDLVGLEEVRPPRRFAIVPYVAGRRTSGSTETDAAGDEETDWRYGGDLSVDLTPSLSFEATFQPDFGQIEADPAVVNLTDYEVFFPEKRPFFLEGAQLLQGRGPRYYYSRRIGAPPHLDSGGIADEGTTITGAAKLIGRSQRGLSVGTLLALTEEEDVVETDPVSGFDERVVVEPKTFYGVVRLQKDYGTGSSLGFVGTGVRRDLPAAGELTALLANEAFAGGLDWNHRFGGRSYEIGGWLGGSYVSGDPNAIVRLQTSSARYYQRPDADYVDLDPTRSELTGYTAGVRLGRIAGDWRWLVSGEARSPGFELNDAGALATADDITSYARLSYGSALRGGPFQRVDVAVAVAGASNFGGIRLQTRPSAEIYLVGRNFWRGYLRVAHETRALSDTLTRGGPLMGTGRAWRYQLGLSSNQALRRVWSIDGSYGSDEFGSETYGASTTLLARSVRRVTLSLTPGYERARETRQFYETVANGRPETYDNRYVFAALEQTTLYARLRATLAFTSDFGFDLYVEPFVARGGYSRFGELAVAGGRELRFYGEDPLTTIVRQPDGTYVVTDDLQTFNLPDRDFDLTSFRVNAVLRWEYLPGSTFYLVWTQNRVGDELPTGQLGARDLFESLTTPAENVFSAKLSIRVGSQ